VPTTIPDSARPPADSEVEQRVATRERRSTGDRIYLLVAKAGGGLTLVLITLIGAFLVLRSLPALRVAGWSFLTETQWNPTGGHFGISAVLFGTIVIGAIALIIAVPISTGAALYITEYAPPRLRRPLTGLVDLMAAVPSLLYGLWGRSFLQPRTIGLSRWLSSHLGFIPLFHVSVAQFSASAFIAGVVVSLMVIPICTAVMREVFSQAPPVEKEGALALGGTKWGMIKTVVLPFGRGGMIGGSMLGLGRALGETIAVTLIISPDFHRSIHILQTGGNSISALIALRFGEANGIALSALMAAGLTLFVVTLSVNLLASTAVGRSRSGRAVEI
jgi:phosphate transport system permease protein